MYLSCLANLQQLSLVNNPCVLPSNAWRLYLLHASVNEIIYQSVSVFLINACMSFKNSLIIHKPIEIKMVDNTSRAVTLQNVYR